MKRKRRRETGGPRITLAVSRRIALNKLEFLLGQGELIPPGVQKELERIQRVEKERQPLNADEVRYVLKADRALSRAVAPKPRRVKPAEAFELMARNAEFSAAFGELYPLPPHVDWVQAGVLMCLDMRTREVVVEAFDGQVEVLKNAGGVFEDETREALAFIANSHKAGLVLFVKHGDDPNQPGGCGARQVAADPRHPGQEIIPNTVQREHNFSHDLRMFCRRSDMKRLIRTGRVWIVTAYLYTRTRKLDHFHRVDVDHEGQLRFTPISCRKGRVITGRVSSTAPTYLRLSAMVRNGGNRERGGKYEPSCPGANSQIV